MGASPTSTYRTAMVKDNRGGYQVRSTGFSLNPDAILPKGGATNTEGDYFTKQAILVAYNLAIPIGTFDFIIIDECHRRIYDQWRQVLDYFDAVIIGHTATPAKQALGSSTHCKHMYDYRKWNREKQSVAPKE